MVAQSTIFYADLDIGSERPPSGVAAALARAANESLSRGQFDVRLQPLSAEDVARAVAELPCGHDRLCLDRNLVLLGAGALLAYAPYRAQAILTCDPFDSAESLSAELGIDIDIIRTRMHDALLAAHKVVALEQEAFDAVAQLLPRRPEAISFPATPLRPDVSGKGAILLVSNDNERSSLRAKSLVEELLANQKFEPYDPGIAFKQPWTAVVHLGVAHSSLPGARLGDAWAGGVPVLQMVSPRSLSAYRRRRAGQLSKMVVDHGKTGLLAPTPEDLVAAVSDLLIDPLPTRSVAKSVKRWIDPAAEWDVLLRSVLQ